MDTTLMAAIALPALTLITYWIVIYFRRRKNDPMQHHGSKECHQKMTANGGEVMTNDFAQNQKQHHQHHPQHQHQQQQRSQKGGGVPAATATKARQNNNANHTVTSSGNNNKRYDNKEQNFNHPWLASTLKGHTKDIRDLDFSSNGKFLASCAEDNLIRRHNSGHRDSTTRDLAASDDVNSSSSSNDDLSAFQQKSNKKSSKSRRNRRQRKNQIEIDDDIIKDNEKQPIVGAGGNNNGNCGIGGQGGIGGGKPHQRKQGGKINATITSATIATLATANNKGSTTSLSSTSSIGSMSSSTTSSPSHTPFGSPTPRVNKFDKISRALAPPLRQHTKLNLQEHEMVKYLRNYIVQQGLLRIYGYPMESTEFEGCAMIYKCLPTTFTGNNRGEKKFQNSKKNIINIIDGLDTLTNKWYVSRNNIAYDSGQGSGSGSGSSSPPSIDSDMSEGGEEEPPFPPLDGSPMQNFSRYHYSLEKHCVRCKSSFLVSENGDYLSQESCVYHWGKLLQTFNSNGNFNVHYSCCKGDSNSEGCTLNRLHVWSGVVVGTNGPYKGFHQTRSKHNFATDGSITGPQKAYALDCEMCYTGLGLECTKITVISCDGQMVYESFVRPQCEIVDYNTRFSGITEKDLSSRNSNVKSLAEVQRDLLQIIDADTILIGHALENDLRALRIIHHNIIDTSISFPHTSGFPFRRALKTLAKVYLNREIQTSDAGHSSFEDSRACLELMLWKIRKEFRLVLEQ